MASGPSVVVVGGGIGGLFAANTLIAACHTFKGARSPPFPSIITGMTHAPLLAGQTSSALENRVGVDCAQKQLWDRLQQSIANAEQADRDFRAMTAVATHDTGYLRVTYAAERARRALLACETAFAQWRSAMDRRVSELE